jgi:hypothetical protein
LLVSTGSAVGKTGDCTYTKAQYSSRCIAQYSGTLYSTTASKSESYKSMLLIKTFYAFEAQSTACLSSLYYPYFTAPLSSAYHTLQQLNGIVDVPVGGLQVEVADL